MQIETRHTLVFSEAHDEEVDPEIAPYLTTLEGNYDPDVSKYLRTHNVPFVAIEIPEGASPWVRRVFVMGVGDVMDDSLLVEQKVSGNDKYSIVTFKAKEEESDTIREDTHKIVLWHTPPVVTYDNPGPCNVGIQEEYGGRRGLPMGIGYKIIEKSEITRAGSDQPASQFSLHGEVPLPSGGSGRQQVPVSSAVAMVFTPELANEMREAGAGIRDTNYQGSIEQTPRIFVTGAGMT